MKKFIAVLLFVSLVFMVPSCKNAGEDSIDERTGTSNEINTQNAENSITTAPTQAQPSENEDASAPMKPNESIDSNEPTESITVPEDLAVSVGLDFESNGDGTCVIVGVGSCDDVDLVIPNVSPTGDTVALIEENAFYSLGDVDSITFLNCSYEIDERAFQYSEFEKVNFVGGAPVLGKSAFSSCEDITSITFEKCNIEIGEYAFYSCGKDATVNFKECNGFIDERAFQYGDFTKVSFENCELKLGESAFSSCENINTLEFTDCTVELGEYAFYSCGNSAKVEFENCSVVLDERAFQYSSLETLSIKGSQFEADKSAFSSCEDLTTVSIDCKSVKLGEYAFYDCEDLITVDVCTKENLESEIVLGDRVFQYCENLKSITIGTGKVEIGEYVFSGCSDELSINIAGEDYTTDAINDGYPVEK